MLLARGKVIAGRHHCHYYIYIIMTCFLTYLSKNVNEIIKTCKCSHNAGASSSHPMWKYLIKLNREICKKYKTRAEGARDTVVYECLMTSEYSSSPSRAGFSHYIFRDKTSSHVRTRVLRSYA